MVVEAVEVATVTDKHSVLVNEVVFQVGRCCVLQFAKHIIRLGFEDAHTIDLAQVGTETLGFLQIFLQIADGRQTFLQQKFSCFDAQGIHGPGMAVLAQQLDGVGMASNVAQSQTWHTVGLTERMEHQQVGHVYHLASLQQRFLCVAFIRLVNDEGIAWRTAHNIVHESLHQHVARRVVGIAYPIDAVAWQLGHFVVILIGDDVVELPAGVSILVERRLGNDRSAILEVGGNHVNSLRSAVGHEDGLWRYAFLQGYQAFETARLGFRIVGYQVEMFLQKLLQRCQIGMLIDVAAEVHLHQIVVAVNVVSVTF